MIPGYKWICILCLAVAASLSGPVSAATAVPTNETIALPDVTGNSAYLNLYVDITSATQQLNITTTGSTGDLDVFLRFGSPFPDPSDTLWGASNPFGSEQLIRYAHYHAISVGSNESLAVTASSTIPLTTGRWYIAILNESSETATGATLNVSTYATPQIQPISIDFGNPSTDASDASNDCDTTPWTDSTAVTPIGSNPGTTLGSQRQNALQYAVTQLAQQLQSPVPITVHACWAHLGGDANSAELAHASSTGFGFADSRFPLPFVAKKYTWYTITQFQRMAGTSYCAATADQCDGGVQNDVIQITFNSDIGSASVIGGQPFYYGYTPDSSSRSADFVSISMHEITHGLGFTGLANTDAASGPIGARAGITTGATSLSYQNYDEGPWDDIYGDNAAIVASSGLTYSPFYGYELLSQPNNAARAAALTSGNTVTATDVGQLYETTLLRWSDPQAVNSPVNQSTGSPPANFPSLYAPCDLSKGTTCATTAGSTLSHTVQEGDLMNAYYPFPPPRTLGLAAPMLAAMGWSTAAAAPVSYAKPFSGSWYDRTHSGHGIDFRLVARNADYGDTYFLIFYSYAADGSLEWFQAQGTVVDGKFIPFVLGADGSTLVRTQYDAATKSASADADTGGDIVIDFNQAANSPACRNVDRSGAPLLGIMSWTFSDTTTGNVKEQGDWCIEPISTQAQDVVGGASGIWYAGPSDSGWGIDILDLNRGSAGNQMAIALYYPDASGNQIWATASALPFVSGQAIPLVQNGAGYCRTCTPVPSKAVQVGTITLNFGTTNTVTLQANYPGGGSFSRSNVPIINGQLPASP